MKAISGKKKKAATIIILRKPLDKFEEQTKIVEVMKTGIISCLEASRNTGFQGTQKTWAGKLNLTSLLNADDTSLLPGIT